MENLDIFKYRIRNINIIENRKIFQQNISFVGNEVKTKLNNQIKLMVRLNQLEHEKHIVALGSSRESEETTKEREELKKKMAAM